MSATNLRASAAGLYGRTVAAGFGKARSPAAVRGGDASVGAGAAIVCLGAIPGWARLDASAGANAAITSPRLANRTISLLFNGHSGMWNSVENETWLIARGSRRAEYKWRRLTANYLFIAKRWCV
jgi:hypothetical protein